MKIKSITHLITFNLFILFTMLIMFTMIEPVARPTLQAQGAEKISPPLRLRLQKGGGQTEFFVILAEKADLREAEKLTGKAKTRYVYQALWETAQTSQAPLKAWLDQQGLSYRAFYIANALLVVGDQSCSWRWPPDLM